jgi:hypothetical protein
MNKRELRGAIENYNIESEPHLEGGNDDEYDPLKDPEIKNKKKKRKIKKRRCCTYKPKDETETNDSEAKVQNDCAVGDDFKD